MYNKGYKTNSLDASEGYNVKLLSPIFLAIFFWVGTGIGFNHDMSIVDRHGLNKNTFSLHWSQKPIVLVRILRDYSSNKINIKVEDFF